MIGLTVNQATSELHIAGFLVAVNHRNVVYGQVYKYSPTGQQPRGSTITIWC